MELPTNKYRKGLSSTESMVLSSLAREDKGIFKIDDVKKFLGKEKVKKIVYSLAKKKWILSSGQSRSISYWSLVVSVKAFPLPIYTIVTTTSGVPFERPILYFQTSI